jgi:hypothetical protein
MMNTIMLGFARMSAGFLLGLPFIPEARESNTE